MVDPMYNSRLPACFYSFSDEIVSVNIIERKLRPTTAILYA